MKQFKLKKDKWYFQSLRETKSVHATEDWAVEISWYASTKDKDRWWDVVEPKAFASALERYMTNPIVLLQHKTDKPIWIVEEADIDDNWLYIKAKISQNTDWVIDLIKNWVLRAFSIWYSVKDYDTDVRELADWTYDMTNIIKDLELYEISVVSVPMNPYALSKSIEDLLEVEEKEEETDSEKCENEEANDTEKCDEVPNEEAEQQEICEEKDENNEEVEEQPTEEKIDQEYVAEEMQDWSVAVEVKDEEVEEEKVVDEAVEETVEENADENSEIEETEVDEVSENVVESTADDEVVDETSNNEVVETKSMEDSSKKHFDFKVELDQVSKSFDEKLAQKDEQIKSLESKVEKMTKLFAESLETFENMKATVKNTPVASGLAYKRPLKKWWYHDIAEIIKSL